jgi:hypothetical protein
MLGNAARLAARVRKPKISCSNYMCGIWRVAAAKQAFPPNGLLLSKDFTLLLDLLWIRVGFGFGFYSCSLFVFRRHIALKIYQVSKIFT